MIRAGGEEREIDVLYWSLMFLIVAIVAGLLGFGGIADVSVGIAQVLFLIFIVLFLVAFIAGAVDRMRQR